MKKARPFIIFCILLGLLSLNGLAMTLSPFQGALPAHYDPTPPPTPTPDPPDGDGGSIIKNITQIFHHLVFPAETISEALANIFNKAAEKESRRMEAEVARWTSVIGGIIQAPSQGDYSRTAQSSLPLAAALAPALFLLRLALYHWGRLLGEDDSGLRVVGDWVTAGVLAVVCGPFLDLVIRLGWWMVGRVIGEAGSLAVEFVRTTSATSVALGIANLTFLGGLLSIGLALGSLAAIAGLLFAFASANAVLFILAVLGPPLAVASVLPQARWLRALWIKAVLLLALLPVVAGGVFKAGMASGLLFSQHGLLSAIVRVIWLWGATGLLLSLAGVLGKMTITTTADALGQMARTVKQVATVAALAASGAGAGAAAGGAAGAASGGTAAAGEGAATVGGGMGAGEAAMSHLNAAQELTGRAATFEALGLHTPAAYNRSLAHGEELAARQAELGARMQRFDGQSGQSPDFGFSPSVNSAIGSSFSGTPEAFKQGFAGLSAHIQAQGLDPNTLAAQYPEDTSRLVQAYLEHQDEINAAPNPLQHGLQLGHAAQLQQVLTFRPVEPDEKDPPA